MFGCSPQYLFLKPLQPFSSLQQFSPLAHTSGENRTADHSKNKRLTRSARKKLVLFLLQAFNQRHHCFHRVKILRAQVYNGDFHIKRIVDFRY